SRPCGSRGSSRSPGPSSAPPTSAASRSSTPRRRTASCWRRASARSPAPCWDLRWRTTGTSSTRWTSRGPTSGSSTGGRTRSQ
ncbi:hypothetical protein ACJX0J_026951, partial [Zea mays]